MKKFFKKYVKNLYLYEEVLDGVHYIFKFDNGYGASVIRYQGSYGYEDGLWELAVLLLDNDGSLHLDYTTPITDNVLGYLTTSKVRRTLKRISKLNRN